LWFQMQMETSANDAISFLDVPADIRHAIFRAMPPATLLRYVAHFNTEAFPIWSGSYDS
jgi:hypothetical protein